MEPSSFSGRTKKGIDFDISSAFNATDPARWDFWFHEREENGNHNMRFHEKTRYKLQFSIRCREGADCYSISPSTAPTPQTALETTLPHNIPWKQARKPQPRRSKRQESLTSSWFFEQVSLLLQGVLVAAVEIRGYHRWGGTSQRQAASR